MFTDVCLKKKKKTQSLLFFSLNGGYHGPNHSAYNQGFFPLSNFLFPSGKHPHFKSGSCHNLLFQMPWLEDVSRCVGAVHQSAVSRVLILTPVSWFGPPDSDHCHGQSHSCSIQPHHLPILTDYCLMATKTKRKRKGTKSIKIMCPERNAQHIQHFSFN